MQLGMSNEFRVTYHKKKLSLNKQHLKVSLHINEPVLDQYNSIDLQKHTHTKRISRLPSNSSKQLQMEERGQVDQSMEKDRWQKHVDRYMQAKQFIHCRKGSTQNNFQFLKLSKINRYRKRKMVQQCLLPIEIIDKISLSQNFQFVPFNQTKVSNKPRYVKTEQNLPSVRRSYTKHNRISTKYQHQKILDNFLSNYFKKKFDTNLKQKKSKVMEDRNFTKRNSICVVSS